MIAHVLMLMVLIVLVHVCKAECDECILIFEYLNIQIFLIRISIRVFIRIIFWIRIYSDIRSCQLFGYIFIRIFKCWFGCSFVSKFWYEYIRIFVRIKILIRIYSDIRSYCFFDTNIFGYSFVLFFSIRIY